MAARVQVSREPKALTKELAAVPKLIAGILAGHDEARLTWRADEKTWSASDLLAHLRSCQEVQGKWIAAMLDRDNPTRLSRSSWNFGGGPVLVRRLRPRHHRMRV